MPRFEARPENWRGGASLGSAVMVPRRVQVQRDPTEGMPS